MSVETKSKKATTPFGRWYMDHSRLERNLILDHFAESGVPKNVARQWMYNEIGPSRKYYKKVEQVLGLDLMLELFPFK